MSPEPDQPDQPTQMRISDADRHQVAEVLREAAGAGRIDFTELDERLEAAYAAKVYGDLVPLLADLPEGAGNLPAAAHPASIPSTAPRPPAPSASGTLRQSTSAIAVMSGSERKGVWQVGSSFTAFALMGGVDLDLREAVFTSAELVINANAVMGGIEIIVNAGTRVIEEGVGIMGGYAVREKVPAQLSEHSPTVRVRGIALMGGVDIVRRAMPGEK